MSVQTFRTSQVARAIGVHPNTVRIYEEWGFLPPVPRAANGYRIFTGAHIDQMRLARLAMRFTWMGGEIRKMTLDIVYKGAAGDYQDSLKGALALQEKIHTEQAYALAAVDALERWARGEQADDEFKKPLTTKVAAQLLDTTTDALRTWERNGLIDVPRNSYNGYRMYGAPEISRLRIIRTLRKAGYSMMAILRMILAFEKGERDNLRHVLDTPRPDDEVFVATDHWITTLDELSQISQIMINLLHDLNAPEKQT